MESIDWLIKLNNEKIRKKSLLYGILLSILFVAYQKFYGVVLTSYITFITMLIMNNRFLHQSYIDNGVTTLLVIYKNMDYMIKRLIRESIKKSLKIIICVLPCILLFNVLHIHESFVKPMYLLLLDIIIFFIMSIILSSLHMLLLFSVHNAANKLLDVVFLFTGSFLLLMYKMNISNLILYYLLIMIFLFIIGSFVKKHTRVNRY